MDPGLPSETMNRRSASWAAVAVASVNVVEVSAMTKSLADVCEQMSPLSEGPASSAFSGRSQGPESRTPSHAAAPTGPFGMP